MSTTARVALETDGRRLWHELLKVLRPQIAVLSVAKDHLGHIELVPISKWETVHIFERKDDGSPRSRPYEVRARWYEIGDEPSLFIFGQAAQTPFGTLPHNQRYETGRSLGGDITMALKRCFVQFPHPGREHGAHQRVATGTNEKGATGGSSCSLVAIGSMRTIICILRICTRGRVGGRIGTHLRIQYEGKRGRTHPRYLWKPFYLPKGTYASLHNTDPFIFGGCFLYSNCYQTNSLGLRNLAKGSVIAFGSKVNREPKWALDTVLVVRDSFPYDPLDPRKGLEGQSARGFPERGL